MTNQGVPMPEDDRTPDQARGTREVHAARRGARSVLALLLVAVLAVATLAGASLLTSPA